MDLRLFIAVELPESWTEALAEVQDRLRTRLPGLRWTRPEGLHLTLKFLGNVDGERVPEIAAAMKDAASRCPAFTLRLGRAGAFGSAGRPRVLWAGVEGDIPAISRLWRAVEEQIGPLGFPPERSRFSPHLTLARVPDERSRETGAAFERIRQELQLPAVPPLEVAAIALMRSELRAGGSRYTRLASGDLLTSAPNSG